MFFNRTGEKSPEQQTSESTPQAPHSSLPRNKGSSDLQTLLKSFNTKMNLTIGDDDDVQVKLAQDEEEPEEHFSLAPIPPVRINSRILPEIPRFQFDEVATFIFQREMLFRLSMEQCNPFWDFLNMEQNSSYLEHFNILTQGMAKFLSKEPPKKGFVSEFDAFIDAFDQIKFTQGFSMSCYLDLHNPALGRYLQEKREDLENINNAFHAYLQGRTPLRKFRFA